MEVIENSTCYFCNIVKNVSNMLQIQLHNNLNQQLSLIKSVFAC